MPKKSTRKNRAWAPGSARTTSGSSSEGYYRQHVETFVGTHTHLQTVGDPVILGILHGLKEGPNSHVTAQDRGWLHHYVTNWASDQAPDCPLCTNATSFEGYEWASDGRVRLVWLCIHCTWDLDRTVRFKLPNPGSHEQYPCDPVPCKSLCKLFETPRHASPWTGCETKADFEFAAWCKDQRAKNGMEQNNNFAPVNADKDDTTVLVSGNNMVDAMDALDAGGVDPPPEEEEVRNSFLQQCFDYCVESRGNLWIAAGIWVSSPDTEHDGSIQNWRARGSSLRHSVPYVPGGSPEVEECRDPPRSTKKRGKKQPGEGSSAASNAGSSASSGTAAGKQLITVSPHVAAMLMQAMDNHSTAAKERETKNAPEP